GANLSEANLHNADLYNADLSETDLRGVQGLVKSLGAEHGNIYWKRCNKNLMNNGYQFYVGLNTLRENETFAADERCLCSYPGFHFASRSWCAVNYPDRPLEAKIRIPEGAKINEPWASASKASADMIEILQVFDVVTGKDVTDKYRKED
ncbi:MAG: pentapeptide repeat-containing protein, partial [Tenuifilaceae bacterium]|nr:pentapeptide repeat-containing protein [Tenuifilaceae bacterium]